MIPGINLLAVASSVIKMQTVQYRAWLSRTKTAAGEWVNQYAPDVPIKGSWQPVDMRRIAAQGLDMKKEYRQIWTATEIKDVQDKPVSRGADRVIADGSVWEPTSTAGDWSSVDGWRSYVMVRIGPAT